MSTAFVRDGGVLSYGAEQVGLDSSRRLLCRSHSARREAGDLPVQFPVKFEMVVNLKTAKAPGLAVPSSIMLRATEVVE